MLPAIFLSSIKSDFKILISFSRWLFCSAKAVFLPSTADNLTSLSFNLLISIPLVNEFGLLGASLSVLISSCVQLVLTIILSLRFSIFTIKPEIYIFVILVGTFSFLDLIKTTFVVDISLIIAAFYLIYFFYMIARQLKEVDY